MYQKAHIIPKKSLGQNFLHSQSIAKHIASLCNTSPFVIEIGPGTGFLTKQLIQLPSLQELYCVEKDTNLANTLLKTEPLLNYNNITIQNADCMEIDFTSIVDFFTTKNNITKISKIHCGGNLPYNVGTAILIKCIQNLKYFSGLTFMLQEEVIDRITANPHTRDYGSLSVICQYFCNVEKTITVKPDNFFPKPKVNSAVVNIKPKQNLQELYDILSFKELSDFCRIIFAQKRKLLTNNIKTASINKKEEFLSKILPHITSNTRAEELSVKQITELAIIYQNHQQSQI